MCVCVCVCVCVHVLSLCVCMLSINNRMHKFVFIFVAVYSDVDMALSQMDPEAAEMLFPDDHNKTSSSIYLRTVTIDTSRDKHINRKRKRSVDMETDWSRDALVLLQFDGIAREEDVMEIIHILGVTLISFVPENAFIVYANCSLLWQLENIDINRLKWIGPYEPAYTIAFNTSDVSNDEPLILSIELADIADVEVTIEAIRSMSVEMISRDVTRLERLCVLTGYFMPYSIPVISRLPNVLYIEHSGMPQLNGERGCQLVADHVTNGGSELQGPGYLDFLSSHGFNDRPFDFVVDITDSGLNSGDITSPHLQNEFKDENGESRIEYCIRVSDDDVHFPVENHDIQDCNGHGTLAASVIAGFKPNGNMTSHNLFMTSQNLFDNLPFDKDGYQYSLGIAPFVRIGSTQIFTGRDARFTFPNLVTIIDHAYSKGALVSSQSWGSPPSLCHGIYDISSQIFDSLVRDARPEFAVSGGEVGNQEMVIAFSAGNVPRGYRTICNAGAAAKNTITVGSSDSFFTDVDGLCPPGDPRDVSLTFASLGPCEDNRVKPDLVAPGYQIFGLTSNSDCYNFFDFCNATLQPANQKLRYTRNVGTSFAVPFVSGASALLMEWFQMHGWVAENKRPSPAMIKAFLMNSAKFLTGIGASSLPSVLQGMGRLDIRSALLNTTKFVLVDQSVLFTKPGLFYHVNARMSDPSQATRITLVWTDAPAAPFTRRALVNDLHLLIKSQGMFFRGNMFNGPYSIPTEFDRSRSFDNINNVESVILPPNLGILSRDIEIYVTAAVIAGDGVPGNDHMMDQDFALVGCNLEGNTYKCKSLKKFRGSKIILICLKLTKC